ncbi:MAG: hypothetical protein AB1486_17595 [Planctomycetota bacterium]
MLANKRLIKIVFTVLALAVAYDVWHLTSGSKRGARGASTAVRAAAAASLAPRKSAVGQKLPAGQEVAAQRALLDRIQRECQRIDQHQACETTPPPSRNPFLLKREQDEGLPLLTILERDRKREEEEKKRRAAEASLAPQQSPRIDLSAFQLTAVLVRPHGSLAVINGNVVGIGDTLPGTSLRVTAIDAAGVELAQGSLSERLGFTVATTPPPASSVPSSTSSNPNPPPPSSPSSSNPGEGLP